MSGVNGASPQNGIRKIHTALNLPGQSPRTKRDGFIADAVANAAQAAENG